MSKPIDEKFLLEAIDRIARSADGRLLYLHLQRRLMAVRMTDDPSALNSDNGERRFASNLMGLMATGISESGGRTSSDSGPGSEQPIVIAVAKPIPVGRATGAARRIGPDTRVPGWDLPDDGSGPG
jgi:hypothetical protein